MTTLKALLVLLSLSVLLAACSSTYGTQFDEKQVSKIEKGKTTQEEIQNLFGDPSGKGSNADGETQWTYSYTHASSLTGYDSKVQMKTLMITFDKSGIVKDFNYQESKQ
jgi:outer membrane protein assembly factor BamE (lipoprotein component of BamABCDE complex)